MTVSGNGRMAMRHPGYTPKSCPHSGSVIGRYHWRERTVDLNWSLEVTYSWANRVRQTVPHRGWFVRTANPPSVADRIRR